MIHDIDFKKRLKFDTSCDTLGDDRINMNRWDGAEGIVCIIAQTIRKKDALKKHQEGNKFFPIYYIRTNTILKKLANKEHFFFFFTWGLPDKHAQYLMMASKFVHALRHYRLPCDCAVCKMGVSFRDEKRMFQDQNV